MGLGVAARRVSDVFAVLAAVVGALLIVFAVEKATSSSPLDVATVPEHWLQVFVTVAAGFALGGYALAHLALRRRPFNRRAIAVRAAFTAAGAVEGTMVVRSAVAFLNSPESQDCGLPLFAARVHILLVILFAAVEFSAWVGWGASKVECPESDAAPDPSCV